MTGHTGNPKNAIFLKLMLVARFAGQVHLPSFAAHLEQYPLFEEDGDPAEATYEEPDPLLPDDSESEGEDESEGVSEDETGGLSGGESEGDGESGAPEESVFLAPDTGGSESIGAPSPRPEARRA